MNDMELADKYERDGWIDINESDDPMEWQQIIAALRRGPSDDPTSSDYIPLCGGHAETWFTGRDHLKDGMKATCVVCAFERPPSGEITEEKIDELWKQAMTEAANHFNGFLKVGMVPNFEHPENLTLPQRFAILLLSAAEAEGRKS